MNNVIGKGVLAFTAMLILAAGVKDFLVDTPDACANRLAVTESGIPGDSVSTYRLYYAALIPIGELTFTKQSTESCKVYSFEASTKGSFLEAFLAATACIKSRVDTTTGRPLEFNEITRVQGQTKSKEIDFDWENHVAHRAGRQINISEDVQDPLSAFVALLSQPLDLGKTTRIRLLAEDIVYVLSATKTKQVNKLAEIQVDISREDQSSSHGAAFTVWISSDAPFVPLLFKSWTPAGYVSVVLDKVEIDSRKTEGAS